MLKYGQLLHINKEKFVIDEIAISEGKDGKIIILCLIDEKAFDKNKGEDLANERVCMYDRMSTEYSAKAIKREYEHTHERNLGDRDFENY